MTYRPTLDEYFMQHADLASTRSVCLRRKVGAVIVVDKQVMATGYNGPPRGVMHCINVKDVRNACDKKYVCLREAKKIPSGERHELCRGLHAEQNCIIQAARHGINIKGGTLYCNFSSCIICLKMLINVGIKRIVYREHYPDCLMKNMLELLPNIRLEKMS